MTTLLAIDTATECMSLALVTPARVWCHDGPGGSRASAQLIPQLLGLLEQAGLAMRDVDAFAFGAGPGAFTGLRTACAVTQGLAFGTGRPVLPIDSLMLVAEDARRQLEPDGAPLEIWVAMDARMDEIYAAAYRWSGQAWHTQVAPALFTPDALTQRWRAAAPAALAGSAPAVFGERLTHGGARGVPREGSRSAALAALALAAWRAGSAIEAAGALPLYLRDKVALTTAERERLRERRNGGAGQTAAAATAPHGARR